MNQLLPENGRFEIGLNYWASHAATEMWSNWREDVIREDLKKIHEYGFSMLRIFPRWDDFQPVAGGHRAGRDWAKIFEVRLQERVLPDTPLGRCGISEIMMERFEKFCDIAAENHLRLIVPLLTGHMTGQLFVPPLLIGKNLYRDPIAMKYEVLFLQGFIERMKHHPAIAAWESGNETNCLGLAESEEEAWIWCYLIHSTIQHADPSRPVVGLSLHLPKQGDLWTLETQRQCCDMVTVHPYALWTEYLLPDSLASLRATHHAPLENKMIADASGKPSFIEETGTWRPQIGSPDTLSHSLRAILWNSWRENAHALLWWCAFDQTNLPFTPYDGEWPGLEHGVFTVDYQAYPVAEVCKSFIEMQRNLPFALPPPRSVRKTVILLDDRKIGYAAGIFARQAGMDFSYARTRQPLPEADVYLLPSCMKRGGFSSRDWEDLKARVRNGATLYVSLDSCFLDRLREVCGCEVLYRTLVKDRTTVDFGDFQLSFSRDFRYTMGSCGAKVLGTEADGNPAFFEYQYGKGKVYTLAYPMESHLMDEPGGLDGEGAKLYEKMFPVERRFRPASCQVLCSEHPFGDGRVALLLVNCSEKAFEQSCDLKVLEQYSDSEAKFADGCIQLPPDGGLLLVVR